MKKLLISFWGNYKLGYLGVISIHFRAFLRPRYRMGMFLGITKFQVFFFFFFFFFWWGRYMPDIPIMGWGDKQ